jgi:hypothetical protein
MLMTHNLLVRFTCLVLAGMAVGCTSAPPPTGEVRIQITEGVSDCEDLLVAAAATTPICTEPRCQTQLRYQVEDVLQNQLIRWTGEFILQDSTPMEANERLWNMVQLQTPSSHGRLTVVGHVQPTLRGDNPLSLTLTPTTLQRCTGARYDVGVLASLDGSSVTATVNERQLTTNGYVLMLLADSAIWISALDTSAVVSYRGRSHILQPNETINGQTLAPATLPRFNPVLVPVGEVFNLLMATATPRPTRPPLPTATECVPNLSWSGRYTVAAGDTIARIAALYDITPSALQAANCLTNPNRLQIGDILFVPDTIAPTVTP